MVQMLLYSSKPELMIFFFGLVFEVNIMDVGCLQTFIDGLQGEQAHGSPNSSNASSFHVRLTCWARQGQEPSKTTLVKKTKIPDEGVAN